MFYWTILFRIFSLISTWIVPGLPTSSFSAFFLAWSSFKNSWWNLSGLLHKLQWFYKELFSIFLSELVQWFQMTFCQLFPPEFSLWNSPAFRIYDKTSKWQKLEEQSKSFSTVCSINLLSFRTFVHKSFFRELHQRLYCDFLSKRLPDFSSASSIFGRNSLRTFLGNL